MTLAQFDAIDVEYGRGPKNAPHPIWSSVRHHLLVFLQFLSIQILVIGPYFGLFVLAHYLQFANPWHSSYDLRPGCIALWVILLFLGILVFFFEVLLAAMLAKDIFKGIFGIEMRKSAIHVSATLYGIMAALFGITLILGGTDGFRENHFGFVEQEN